MDIKQIIDLMEALFNKMLPDAAGHEKQLELYLINASPAELENLAKKYL